MPSFSASDHASRRSRVDDVKKRNPACETKQRKKKSGTYGCRRIAKENEEQIQFFWAVLKRKEVADFPCVKIKSTIDDNDNPDAKHNGTQKSQIKRIEEQINKGSQNNTKSTIEA